MMMLADEIHLEMHGPVLRSVAVWLFVCLSLIRLSTFTHTLYDATSSWNHCREYIVHTLNVCPALASRLVTVTCISMDFAPPANKLLPASSAAANRGP